ncbi:DNA internalization competence protein comec/rec2 [Rhodococcus sp. RD6.2]|uniref:ComEC/Rec2 family competence protein n=1 Tax=Rhodococcus sp. RD6.2 TaxID=260936 RepID=UPI00063B3E95|nr:ComEC/Rec2 family competence protein [Rhodococcus sp. RD6.2]CRK54054.1 DNA internalization competence protein comec/rec2 [Rhodococcus sp. RD6.2]
MSWAATAVGIGLGWRAAVWFAAVALAGAVAAAGLRRHSAAVAGAVIAALLVGAGFAGATALRVHAVRSHPLAAVAERGGHVTLTAVVVDDPRPVRGPAGGSVLVRVSLRSMDTARGALDVGGAVLVFAPIDGWQDLLPGQRVQLRGRVGESDRADLTVAVVQATGPPTEVGDPPWHQRAAGHVRQRFAEAASRALPTDAAGLLPGLVVGDTSDLPEPVDDDFTAAGLSHLTAVSGANISILLGAILLLTRAAALGPRTTAAIAGVALVGFVVVARPSASVLRAAAMGAVVLLAMVVGRRRQAVPALAAAVVALLAWFPELAVSYGFALSVAATAALVLIAPRWARRWQRRGWPRAVAEAVSVAVAAHVVTVPIVAAMSGTVSMVAVAANLLVAPVIAPVTVIGAVAAAGATAWVPLGEVVALATGPPLWWLLRVAREAAEVPGASVVVPSGAFGFAILAVTAAAAITAVAVRRLRIVAIAVVIGLAVAWIPLRMLMPGWPVAGWVLVACDVGQGDALVLDAGDGSAVVVDAGPASRPVDGCLDRLGVRSVTAVVLTHLHADHVDGLPGVLHGRTVEQIVTGPMRLPTQAYEQVRTLASGAGVPLTSVHAGQALTVGTLTLRVLGPTLPAPSDPEDADDAANDQSLVLTVDTVAGRILLTGDVEAAGQRDLIRDGVPLTADILKLPHHGSRTTAPEFLRAVGARVVVVSVGAGNTFGHPNPDILRAVRETGATVARTDLGGDIAVSRAGGGGVAVTYRRGTIVR